MRKFAILPPSPPPPKQTPWPRTCVKVWPRYNATFKTYILLLVKMEIGLPAGLCGLYPWHVYIKRVFQITLIPAQFKRWEVISETNFEEMEKADNLQQCSSLPEYFQFPVWDFVFPLKATFAVMQYSRTVSCLIENASFTRLCYQTLSLVNVTKSIVVTAKE